MTTSFKEFFFPCEKKINTLRDMHKIAISKNQEAMEKFVQTSNSKNLLNIVASKTQG